MATTTQPVNIDYNDLVSGKDLSDLIREGFGPNGLGIVTVSNVPELAEKRKRLLPLAFAFAQLSDEVKEKYVHKQSNYSFGWSHGKEIFNGRADTAKGSYYANPTYDEPTDDPELIKRYPGYCTPNIWPRDDLPELEHAFKDVGRLIVDTGLLLAKHCDKFVRDNARNDGSLYGDKLHNVIRDSRCAKGRLLNYFPVASRGDGDDAGGDEEAFDSWCGWHLDHGSLTGLLSAMYFDSDGNEVANTDAMAGLYIKTRDGTVVKAQYSGDRLAYQIGESAQIHSGGLLEATPHCVRVSGQSYTHTQLLLLLLMLLNLGTIVDIC